MIDFNKILKHVNAKLKYLNQKYLIRLERNYFLKYNFLYRNYLRLVKGFKFSPKIPPKFSRINTTLKSKEEINLALKTIEKSRLNPHNTVIEKNWDSLIALNILLRNSDNKAAILDAGGEIDSLILSWLYQFGYNNLKCLNLVFKKKEKRGDIEFIPGDLTKTPFSDNFFDAVLCLSVIEHGVDEDKFFEEMNRILKKGGLLITSTDYWETKLEIIKKIAYNHPVYVYDKNSVKRLLDKAYSKGFKLFGSEIDLNCKDKVVHWKRIGLKFTFLIFCLQKE